MRLVRLRSALLGSSLSLAVAALAFGAVTLAPCPTASASVSIAVGWDALLKDADAVAVITPVESKSVWEGGRIYTYTRVKVDQGVAGDLGTGAEAWVRTMGGVVGKVGQLVDGEPVFVSGKSSLLFMRKFQAGAWEVSARAQGQYPIVLDASKVRKVIKNANVGMLFPPKPKVVAAATEPGVKVETAPAGPPAVKKIRLASEVIQDRPLDEVTRQIAADWKKAHPPAK
jgi:hypothetical protein